MRFVFATQVAAMSVAAMAWTSAAAAPVEPKIPIRARFFDLRDANLLDGPFLEAQKRNSAYLLSLDVDRLLHNFRVTAGLPSSARPLGGWERPDCELRGHSVGHYLTACALAWRATGDAAIKAKGDAVVAGLAECQKALPGKGFNKGFLSAYPESFFDRVDACERVWAPYYTLHKIMAGLLDMHQLAGNGQALEVLENMADWLKFRVGRLSREQQQKALGLEHGGMNEVFANLYGATGNPDHLKLAIDFNHDAVLEPSARGEDRLNGLHANTQIPKFIGAAREYELTGDRRYRDMAEHFWGHVAFRRSYVIGGNSDGEHFFPVENFSKHLGVNACETCNTYNMLKLTRHLFAWSPSAGEMDFYERALLNHILASQNPDDGMFCYYMSMKPGHFKVYSTPHDSFWCCVGTGMENHAKYADTIYAESGDDLWINLFIPSELRWKDKGAVVRMETRYPLDDTIRLSLKLDRPQSLNLKIRRPAWAEQGFHVRVNGAALVVESRAGTYATVAREWKDGDTVEIRIPMTLRIEAMPDDPSVPAFLWGPTVLAGDLGPVDRSKLNLRGQSERSGDETDTVPVLVGDDNRALLSAVAPAGRDRVAFVTRGIGRPADVTLVPYYSLHFKRYTVYWKRMSEKDWKANQERLAAAEAERRELEKRIVDEVKPGESQSETDHAMKGEKTDSGDFMDRKWRHAAGGWFSYALKVPAGEEVSLRVTYWGGDGGNRVFDILVDGEKIASQKLDHNKPNEFFDVEYPIPETLTRGKETIAIRFEAQPGRTAGGVFGVRTLKKK